MAQQDGDGSFEQRLQSARLRQGQGSRPRAGGIPAFSAWGLGARVGTELVAAVVVGAALGALLDWFCHTSPVFLMLLVPVGGAAGVLNVWRVLGPRKS
jgi:ATP synthase protein I